jgi:hypothetical protein
MHTARRSLQSQATVLVALALLTARGGAAQGPAFATLYSFKGGSDGASPNGVTLSKNGALYGTTYTGGTNTCGVNVAYLCGTVFELARATGGGWTKTVLHSFNGADGAVPSPNPVGAPGPRLAFGSNGALYGTTEAGGSNDSRGNGIIGGTVFELVPPATAGGVWTETVLYSFSGSLNAPHTPLGGVLIGPSGAAYGTTFSSQYIGGGADFEAGGTVFALKPPSSPGGSWTERTLFNLWPDGAAGINPTAGLVSAGGSFYGTTPISDGGGGCGSVYEVSPPTASGGAWTGTAIYEFEAGGSCNSDAPVTVGPGGVLYGTTYNGGSGTVCITGCGTVFQLTPPAVAGGAWTEAVIYSFTGTNGDGASPAAGVTLGKNGVLYGSTTYGGSATAGCHNPFTGANGCGTVFELTPPATPGGAWTETILHTFTGPNGDGSLPGPLTVSRVGVLYGPTLTGGTAGKGTIFAIQP